MISGVGLKIHMIMHSTMTQIAFYPTALKDTGVLSSPERAGGRADKPC